MSYSTIFRLKEDLDSKFKGFYSKPVTKQERAAYKNALIALCMENILSKDFYSLVKVYNTLYTAVSLYVAHLEEDWKQWLQETLKDSKEIDFYGWEYTDNGDISIYETREDLITGCTTDLYYCYIAESSEKYDENSDSYHEKLEDVSSLVDDIEDSVNRFWNKEFVEFYRNSDKADESDGYNHFFPEEVKQEISDEESVSRGEDSSTETE